MNHRSARSVYALKAIISPSTVIDTICEKEKPRHTMPKRFSLIDFEDPHAVNSTGMHRNATPLNSSAMERLRSLSAPTSPPSRSSFSPLLSAVKTALLLIPLPFPAPSRRAFPTFVLIHADVVQYLHTDR